MEGWVGSQDGGVVLCGGGWEMRPCRDMHPAGTDIDGQAEISEK